MKNDFEDFLDLYRHALNQRDLKKDGPHPVWTPTPEVIQRTNLYAAMKKHGGSFESFYRFSIENRAAFWTEFVETIHLPFKKPFAQMLDLSRGVELPNWLVGAELNMVDACLRPSDPARRNRQAIIEFDENLNGSSWAYSELDLAVSKVAGGLKYLGFKKGDAIAIDMLMSKEAVAIYLGILKIGAVVVSIADSFAPDEIKVRLDIAKTKAIFCNDFIVRSGKKLDHYSKIKLANAPRAIVLPYSGEELDPATSLRINDLTWKDFVAAPPLQDSVAMGPHDPINILFSSGTTGEPKAIPWDSTTAIKAAMDAYYHQDVHSDDRVAWPTNLGWMMGPWLIFASFVPGATMALFKGAPSGEAFAKFLEIAKVSILGLVPSIVKQLKNSRVLEDRNLSSLRLMSSSGECSNPEDMLYMMWVTGLKPVIEYCGGTEIGGGYITSTLVQPNSPSAFSTPALGLSFVIQEGELFLVPPSMGLSRNLLNRDHHAIYYEGTPLGPEGAILRRHGDEIEALGGGTYRAHGRVDDTMNLGGIKVSSAEIERTLQGSADLLESAAVAIPPPGGGPSLLVIFAVLREKNKALQKSSSTLKEELQHILKRDLNPLFKIHEVRLVDQLPRTASNKILRRNLRQLLK